jgi:hypothetical protein
VWEVLTASEVPPRSGTSLPAEPEWIPFLVCSGFVEEADDRERSLCVRRSLPADIWATNHARMWGRYRKFVASTTAKNPVDAFIDPEGYRAFIDAAEAELREGRMH